MPTDEPSEEEPPAKPLSRIIAKSLAAGEFASEARRLENLARRSVRLAQMLRHGRRMRRRAPAVTSRFVEMSHPNCSITLWMEAPAVTHGRMASTCGALREWDYRSPKRWRMPIARAFCTATSSLPTCCSMRTALSGSPILASRNRKGAT